jgi:hypothetical protein
MLGFGEQAQKSRAMHKNVEKIFIFFIFLDPFRKNFDGI